MKLGIVTPALTLLPRAHAQWEETADVATIVDIVREAERLGYHHCTCSEHVAVPVDVAEVRGGRYWDPLATFGYLAAVTERIKLATHVLVLGYHHPLEIAKRYGTLDVVSDGRLILGVGRGIAAGGVRPARRAVRRSGRRADDAMRALRAALSQREPEYSGAVLRVLRLPRRSVRATGRGPDVGRRPLRTDRCAGPSSWATAGRRSASAAPRSQRAWTAHARPPRGRRARSPLEVILQNERPLDPGAEPDRVAEAGPTPRRRGRDRRSTSASSTTPPRTTKSSSPPSAPSFDHLCPVGAEIDADCNTTHAAANSM